MKYLEGLREFFAKTPVFSSRDIKAYVSGNYRHLLVSNLIKGGEIKKVTKGYYTLFDDPIVSVFCFKPAYIGLQEALSVHNVWEQEGATIIVTAKKVKKRIINVFGNNVVLHRIKPKYMFGFEAVRYGKFYVPVSNLEKTFIDLVYFNEIPDKNTLRNMKKRLDAEKIKKYLEQYPEKIKKRVLSFL